MIRNEEDNPILVANGGPLNGQRIVLANPIVVGREPACDVVVPDRQVSRYHARFTPGKEGIILEDLGSKNGTQINGHPLKGQVVLKDGDVVKISIVQEFIFLSTDATLPLLSPQHKPGRLVLEKSSRRVWVNQELLNPPLSALQFQLLWVLYERQGEVVTRPDLVAAVWGDEQSAGVSDQAVDALIRRLRDRIVALDSEYPYISTVRGHGHRLDNPLVE